MSNKENIQDYAQTLLQQASKMEEAGNIKEAAKLYKQSLKKQHRDEKVYNRLMVIFRKMKDYRNESLIIQRAIKAFETFYDSRKITIGNKIANTSKNIMRAFGMLSKTGKPIYMLQPIDRWNKRLQHVNRKLEKAATN